MVVPMDQMFACTLYSIGHSNVTTDRLLALLDQHAIAVVCDVRSVPYSRYTPQFNREELAAVLPENGISYHWFGEALGGIPQDTALRTDDGRADYEKIATTPRFQHELKRLIKFGMRAPAVFMCSEADYHGCHRHKLLTPALLERGVTVRHIMADGRLEMGEIEPAQLRMF